MARLLRRGAPSAARKLAAGAAILACGIGCSAVRAVAEGAEAEARAPAGAGAPAGDELADAAYEGLGELGSVRLVGGRWEGEPFVEGGASRPAVGLAEGFRLAGDLDGDGSEEAAVILWTSSGGSGTFDHLAVVGRRNGSLANLGTAPIGDRVQVRAGRVRAGRIELDVVQAGPGDARCCPTQKATRTWTLGAGGLSEVSAEITGKLSLLDLGGAEWVLTHLGWGERAPAEPAITLVFEPGRVAGRSACNRYFGAIAEEGETPGRISVGPLGSTKMACREDMMALEDRYLEQLGVADSYGFVAGKLALSWRKDEAQGTMLFTPRPPAE